MTLSPNEMTPYIRKIQQKFDEAQTFLVKNGFHQATKGLLQDIQDANESFEILMGDDVEPRREFIDANALSIKELDI